MTNKKNIMNADLSPIEFRESLNFEEHDMKKEEFDKKIACAKQYINSVITSKNQITIECVQNISKILGDPLAQFAEILLQEQIDNVYKVNFPQMDELK